ncbi:MAG: hypothetical protein IPM61_00175 [Chlorobi bacterium]|nr:hypothetical protein [Chlorobiota bacterium]
MKQQRNYGYANNGDRANGYPQRNGNGDRSERKRTEGAHRRPPRGGRRPTMPLVDEFATRKRRPRVFFHQSNTRLLLPKLLTKARYLSPALAKQFILSGRIRINARVVTSPFYEVNLRKERATIDELPTEYPRQCYYMIFHKPVGMACERGDPKFDELFEPEYTWSFPFGRLTRATCGLVILTNDPRFIKSQHRTDSEIQKEYLVKINKVLTEQQLWALRSGVMIGEDYFVPFSVEVVQTNKDSMWLRYILLEDSYQNIFSSLKVVAAEVLRIERTRIGMLNTQMIPNGEWRELLSFEVAAYSLDRFMFGELPPEPPPPPREYRDRDNFRRRKPESPKERRRRIAEEKRKAEEREMILLDNPNAVFDDRPRFGGRGGGGGDRDRNRGRDAGRDNRRDAPPRSGDRPRDDRQRSDRPRDDRRDTNPRRDARPNGGKDFQRERGPGTGTRPPGRYDGGSRDKQEFRRDRPGPPRDAQRPGFRSDRPERRGEGEPRGRGPEQYGPPQSGARPEQRAGGKPFAPTRSDHRDGGPQARHEARPRDGGAIRPGAPPRPAARPAPPPPQPPERPKPEHRQPQDARPPQGPAGGEGQPQQEGRQKLGMRSRRSGERGE